MVSDPSEWKESKAIEQGYPLRTGTAGAERLRLLNRVFGQSTQRLLTEAGLISGMNVIDVGCGIGTVTRWIAKIVGGSGKVIGVDVSAQQIQIARDEAAAEGLTNIEFEVSDAKLLTGGFHSFDLAYCRLLLCHLSDPYSALKVMHDLVKSDGVVACEELDLREGFTEPPQVHFDSVIAGSIERSKERGANYRIGRQLPLMFDSVGLSVQGFGIWEPGFLSGEEKRFIEQSNLEEISVRVEKGHISEQEAISIRGEMARVMADQSILVFQSRIAQIWGIRRAS